MKKIYLEPHVQVECFKVEDVITTSNWETDKRPLTLTVGLSPYSSKDPITLA